jgi:hypothetical protein
MLKKIKNIKGIGLVITLLILLLTLIIAIGGWYYYANKYQVVDNQGIGSVLKTVDANSDINLSDYTKYHNKDIAIEFSYPKSWIINPISPNSQSQGLILELMTAEQQTAFISQPDIKPSLRLSFWPNINNQYALGGELDELRTYDNLDDYLNSPEYGYKKALRTIKKTGYDMHYVTIGGYGESYGVMFETSQGVYELNFASTTSEQSATQQINQIINTIKILSN